MSELRERLRLLPTAELVGILEGLDVEQWRPEVFPLVESILRDRGLDVTGKAGCRREPTRSHDRAPRIHKTVNHWKIGLIRVLRGHREIEQMSTELRERLGLLPTAELVGILECLDVEQWRPEVFPVVEDILRDRGLDVKGIAGRGREPTPSEPPIPTLNHWESIALASLITLASSAVGIPIVACVGWYIGFSAFAHGPSLFAIPMALSVWWVAVLAILSGLRRISRLPYVSEAFAAAMVAGQAGVFAVPLVFPRSDTVFTRHDFMVSIAAGAVIAFAFVARAGRGQH